MAKKYKVQVQAGQEQRTSSPAKTYSLNPPLLNVIISVFASAAAAVVVIPQKDERQERHLYIVHYFEIVVQETDCVCVINMSNM